MNTKEKWGKKVLHKYLFNYETKRFKLCTSNFEWGRVKVFHSTSHHEAPEKYLFQSSCFHESAKEGKEVVIQKEIREIF